GTLTIPNTFEPGLWKISSLSIYDNVGNNITVGPYYGHDVSSAEFTVSGSNPDVQAPTFNSISVDKKEVKPGDRIKISIDAVDHESGIKTIALYYKTPITGKNEYVGIYYNSGTGRYEGTLTIPNTFEPGLWKISSLSIYDNVGNNITVSPYYGYDLSDAEFKVGIPSVDNVNVTVDHASPVLK
ncbi:hypothetical protein, partial [Bacillus sp. RC206]|uniref:hypothetical protein n=1 Tax=Bacillus sp. RC206 TaxID=3156281 RepID=UPI003835D80C